MKSLPLGAVALSTLALCMAAPQTLQAQTYQEGVQQWDLAMINAQAAYDRGYTGAGVVVGVVDSGMQMDHPDLVSQLSGISLDGILGGPVTYDLNGHGTHVAGIVAAARDGVNTHGVAFDARLAPLRLLGDDGFAPDDPMAVANLYNLALEVHPLHIGQHLMFIAASVMMWWPVVSPVPELSRLTSPMKVLYIFVFGIPMSVVAAFVTLATTPLYPWYEAAPRMWGLTPLADQQMAGAIMWVPGMIVYWTAMTIVFLRWAGREERQNGKGLVAAQA